MELLTKCYTETWDFGNGIQRHGTFDNVIETWDFGNGIQRHGTFDNGDNAIQ
jgi:hypothetical protein